MEEKERAAKEIEGIRTYKVGPQVRIPIPKNIAAFYRLISQNIKRYLLAIVISYIEKISLVLNYVRDKKGKGRE